MNTKLSLTLASVISMATFLNAGIASADEFVEVNSISFSNATIIAKGAGVETSAFIDIDCYSFEKANVYMQVLVTQRGAIGSGGDESSFECTNGPQKIELDIIAAVRDPSKFKKGEIIVQGNYMIVSADNPYLQQGSNFTQTIKIK